MKSAARWDADFRAGKLDFLHRPGEQRRLSEIAAMIGRSARQRGPVEVADLGCGEGLLLRQLDPSLVKRYVAIDISGVALKSIREGRVPVARVRSSVAAWDGRPEPIAPRVIVASEVLYYDPQGVTHLRKAAANTQRTVEVIVSCVAGRPDKPNWTASSLRLWHDMRLTGWRRLEMVTVRDERAGLAWDIARYAL
jgi:SAM-dependent methyltransferase